MVRLLSLCFISVFLSCTSSKDTAGGNDYFVERNILWFDATANFDRFCNKDSITYYLQKSKEVGITDVVVDVKPITGEVLYPSAIAPVMKSWGEGKMVKDTTWDMLSYFLTEGHKLGLKVHASTNVFVAGHNFFDRGVVYSDSTKAAWQTISYLPEGFKPITEQKSKYSAMINPALKEVRDYELSILKELVTMYPTLDGIILDRVRFDNLNADFSSESRALFETHMGQKVENFPADIFSFENKERKEGKLFKPWLEWRAKIIHDFIYETRDALKKINPKLIFGDYTGSWYPLYFDVGVNFASKSYDPSTEFEWATPNYKNYGYAEALDLFTTGNYYFEVEKTELLTQKDTTKKTLESGLVVKKEDWYTVEGSAELVNKVTMGKTPVYAGLYVEQYKDNPEQFIKALQMCRAKSKGAMVFDIVHIINYGWWNHLATGLKK
ncbi:alpha amylase family protein [Sphingobacterium psychroaquaticum]|uniref:Glycosyl hydrolase-like 10 n=1 Tax=Sphingobacterium psychroaquaticum TaxID=561061 RepID=A0A1X7KHD5_9SPHI|nr:alpha amylase family protein [Sphingobacterium psychroaquaticum]QBQ42770.1 S-layer protein [Sphingobacterium psychroaquaticum]SMG40610.1 Glycosyl hydrolase-like 10 [Sphingobacterium psychroaquaticum]